MLFKKPVHTGMPALVSAAAIALVAAGTFTAQPASALACSVTDYGAVANDSSDDTSKIQAALNSGCGIVSLPAGTYKLSATLRIPSNSGLSGTGVLNQTADVTTILNSNLSAGNTVIRLSNFKIQKNFVRNSLADGIRLEKSKDVRITGVEITGISARNGIELLQNDNFLADNNYLHDFSAVEVGIIPNGDGDPVSIDSIYVRSSTNGTVSNNRVKNMDGGTKRQSDGVLVTNSRSIKVLTNVISNVGEGVDVGNSDDVLVSGNTVSDAGLFGMKVGNGSTTTTVEKNTISRAQLSGIHVFSGPSVNGATESVTISRNNIYNVGAAGRTGDPNAGTLRAGISVEGDRAELPRIKGTQLLNNLIEDNQSVHTMEFGIYIDQYTESNTVLDNTITGYTREGYRNLS